MADAGGEWASLFQRVKQRPPAFYDKCAARLESQDLFDPSDLAELDLDMFMKQLAAGDAPATAGEMTFLRLAVELAKSDAGCQGSQAKAAEPEAQAKLEAAESRLRELEAQLGAAEAAAGAGGGAGAEAALGQERLKAEVAEQELLQERRSAEAKLGAMEERLRAAEASAGPAAAGGGSAEDEGSPAAPVFPVISVILPGTEDCEALLGRGGLELTWKGGQKVSRFREKPLPRIVQADLALPTLYLHFLGSRFLPGNSSAFDNALRAGNDNSELQIILPEAYTGAATFGLTGDLLSSLNVVREFMKGHGEVEISSLKAKGGGFSPEQNFAGAADPQRLYFGLKTARPKASINLDKKAFGIPESADLYLFAQNHSSVEHMTTSESEAFQTCIAEFPSFASDDVKELATFIKIFYEGGFAYNHKDDAGRGYIPRNVGIAGLGVVPSFPGQVGIATGYPFLLEASFLRFTDTVPVTIPAITAMSPRHGRYGLCFTRCCFVWEDEAFAREGVLRFNCPIPYGGFFYVPSRLRSFRKLGGLVYAFGGAKEELEVPLCVDGARPPDGEGAAGRASPAAGPADFRVCVVCLEESAQMATVPCGHRTYCASCAPRAQGNRCPVCRQPVARLMRVY